jgi:DNA-binding response OmpR family regulator
VRRVCGVSAGLNENLRLAGLRGGRSDIGAGKRMRVLVVEDEMSLADAVARGLRRHGASVDVAYDGDDGYSLVTSEGYDVLVLDRDLPGMSGDDICKSVTDEGLPVRVLMLTASVSEQDRAKGLALGAADYVNKPFSFADLLQRVIALAGSSPPAAAQ